MRHQIILRNYSLLIFFVLTYALSWMPWMLMVRMGRESRLLLIVGTFGPTSAALLLTGMEGGWEYLYTLLEQLWVWRVSVFWYLFSFLGTAVVAMAALGIHMVLGGEIPQFNDPRQLYLVIPILAYVLFLSVLGEEMGWRGYALPRLQKKLNALAASLIIGVVWGIWHLPQFWMKGNFHQEIPLSLFVMQSIALSVVMTWLYNSTQSLLIVHLFHAASNTTLGILPILPMDTGGELRPLWIAVGLLWAVAIVIVIVHGPTMLSHKKG